MKIYIAGPYRADTIEQRDANIQQARDACAEIFRRGHTPFCPHAMTARFDDDYPDIDDERFLETGIKWLECCDAILMLPGWEDSSGSRAERKMAEDLDLWIYESLDDIPPYPFEKEGPPCPECGHAVTILGCYSSVCSNPQCRFAEVPE